MSKTTAIIISVAAIVILALVAYGVLSKKPSSDTSYVKVSKNYTLTVAGGEQLAVARTQQAIAQSAVDSTGELSVGDCSLVGDVAKNSNRQAKWFADCSYVNYGSSMSNDTEETMKLSDGNYCATFTFVKGGKELVDYKFTEGSCGDYRIKIQ